MKRQRVWACALALFLCFSCAAVNPLSGRWKGEDEHGNEVVLFLAPNGDFEAIAKGERLAGTWSVDEAQDPDRIDLIFEGRAVSSIFKMQGDNLLIEPVGDDGKAPTKFSGKATFYKRQK